MAMPVTMKALLVKGEGYTREPSGAPTGIHDAAERRRLPDHHRQRPALGGDRGPRRRVVPRPPGRRHDPRRLPPSRPTHRRASAPRPPSCRSVAHCDRVASTPSTPTSVSAPSSRCATSPDSGTATSPTSTAAAARGRRRGRPATWRRCEPWASATGAASSRATSPRRRASTASRCSSRPTGSRPRSTPPTT